MEKEAVAAKSIIDEFRHMAEQASGTSESVSLDLRIQFSSILGRLLKQKEWSQADLSRATGIHQPEISEYMHADANITVDQIGRILDVFGVRGRLTIVQSSIDDESSPSGSDAGTAAGAASPAFEVTTDGQEIISKNAASDSRFSVRTVVADQG